MLSCDGHVRKEADILEHVADAPSQIERVPLRDQRSRTVTSPLSGSRRPIDQFEDRALAGAAAPHERERLALGDVEIDALEHVGVAPCEPDSAEGNLGQCAVARLLPPDARD